MNEIKRLRTVIIKPDIRLEFVCRLVIAGADDEVACKISILDDCGGDDDGDGINSFIFSCDLNTSSMSRQYLS